MTIRPIRWDIADHLKTDEERAMYLQVCLEEGGDDSVFIAKTLRAIASAKGINDLAALAGLEPATLSGERELTFSAFLKATQALGIKISCNVMSVPRV